jgi:DNA-binding SARP family transcriptional activator/tetratricopeptide (TPR) repeat protein
MPSLVTDVPAEFLILGPVDVVREGVSVHVTSGRTQVILAMLLLDVGQVIPFQRLVEALWEDDPPSTARSQVQMCVSTLRRLLTGTGAVILTQPPGYLLRIPDGSLDLWRFRELCVTAESLSDRRPEEAAAHYREALALWRGDACASVASQVVMRTSIRLNEDRWTALDRHMDLELRLGRHQHMVAELAQLVATEPLRERPRALLMLALYRSGRQAEALEVYRSGRRLLAEELGADPGKELRALEQAILTADPSLDIQSLVSPQVGGAGLGTMPRQLPASVPVDVGRDDGPGPERKQLHTELAAAAVETEDTASAALPGPGGPPAWFPTQLPADIADFTGRGVQVDYLCDALTRRDVAGGSGAVRIAVVAGTAGFGKTVLAVHTAHQVRDLFPDGQLYVALSGASSGPAAPGEVLARLLRDLGVDGDKVPAGDEERAALYRTRLTGRRVLILLDDAKDVAQVRPLLPGSASCAVLVTTRNRTPYLVSTGFVDLDVLPGRDALELFSRIVGGGRTAAEPEATAKTLSACAGLPLAIRICAARLATRRQWRIATMAARIRDERRRLDEFQVGDLEVRASFQVSYDSLRAVRHSVDPAHAFRLLGLWPGQRISLPAAAALIGEPEADAAVALETLVDASLLESPEPDWYQFHDLLRLFATERAQAEEPQETRSAAVTRLLRWYLGMAVAAADVVARHRYRIQLDDPEVPSMQVRSAADALGWYESERTGIIAAIRQAAAAGLHSTAWQLATAAYPLFNRRDNWTDCATAHRIALDSARVARQRQAEAWALQNLGFALARSGDEEALVCLEEALAIRREIGDLTGEAQTDIALVEAYARLQGTEAAFGHSLHSLEKLRQMEDPALLTIALSNHGECCLQLGRLDEAAGCFREALSIITTSGESIFGRGHVTENLGRVHLGSGHLSEAIARLAEAYRFHLAAGDLRGQASTLKLLGAAQRKAGREERGRKSLAAALVLFKKLKEDAEVRAIQATLAKPAQRRPASATGTAGTRG